MFIWTSGIEQIPQKQVQNDYNKNKPSEIGTIPSKIVTPNKTIKLGTKSLRLGTKPLRIVKKTSKIRNKTSIGWNLTLKIGILITCVRP